MAVQWRKKMFLDGGADMRWRGYAMEHTLSRGIWGHAPPGKFLKFECSKINSGAF